MCEIIFRVSFASNPITITVDLFFLKIFKINKRGSVDMPIRSFVKIIYFDLDKIFKFLYVQIFSKKNDNFEIFLSTFENIKKNELIKLF